MENESLGGTNPFSGDTQNGLRYKSRCILKNLVKFWYKYETDRMCNTYPVVDKVKRAGFLPLLYNGIIFVFMYFTGAAS